MDQESKDLLREWLVRSLEPVCDADPEVLSKYVLALVQHDLEKEGLRETCIAKLEEFLGDETEPFVDRLFDTLTTGAYRKNENDEQPPLEKEQVSSREPHHAHRNSHYHDGRDYEDKTRRRSRHYGSSGQNGVGGSDDEEERRRVQKRRREDEARYHGSPTRRGNGERGGGRIDRGDHGPVRDRSQPVDGRGRRMYPPGPVPPMYPAEWGMVGGPFPPMWNGPPPRYPPRNGGFPHHFMGENDFPDGPPPVGYSGMMMHPPHGAPGGFGYGGRHGGRSNGRGRGFGGRFGGPPPPSGDEPPLVDGNDGTTQNQTQMAPAKTTLRVSNVDPKYVNMTKLSLHFSKFGNVVNVQMRPQHRCAYVQYASEEEAKKAFHSPIPVCNNRFIEVKWAKYDAKDPHGAPREEEGDGDNGGVDHTASASAANNGSTEDAPTEPTAEMTLTERRAAALEKGRQVLEQKRTLLDQQRQLMKQKEALIKRQLAQQKELLERMSQNAADVSIADKRELLNKITALSEELKSLQPTQRQPLASNQGVEDAPNSLTVLKAELHALETQVGGRHGGRGSSRGGRWGRGGRSGRGGRYGGRGMHSNVLDNRTTIIKVEHLPEEARDPSVLEQHFGAFGTVVGVVMGDDGSGSGFIKFQDRYGGQAALGRGRVFGDSALQLSWVEVQDAPPLLSEGTAGVTTAEEANIESTIKVLTSA